MKKVIVRQGDCGFVKITREKYRELSKNLCKREVKSMVLAHGEATGHKHVLMASQQESFPIFFINKSIALFEVAKELELRHETHGTLNFLRGYYLFALQREYNEYKELPVRD